MAAAQGSTGAVVYKACEAYLSLLVRDLQRQGLNINVVCLTGNTAREIIHYADEQQVDLIAMASHGSGEVAWFLGSIANKVITYTSRPVMLFRILELELPSLKAKGKGFI
jgi:nucleotide-binding universal stress UspA family protein